MPRERLIRVGILAVLGLALMGMFRPSSPDPKEDVQSAQTTFFINKAHNQGQYDLVIVGDSRALRGMASEILEKQLPGQSIYNLSFHAGGLNQQMYQEAEKLLQPGSPRKSILLAPTSLAFLPHKKSNSQFNEYRGKPRDQVWLYQNHPGWAEFFQPVSPSVYLRSLLDLKPHELLFQEFKSGGWIATNQTPHDDVTDFSDQKEILASFQIDPTLIDDLMTQTRDWTARGIEVYGLFPPAYSPRVAFEDSILGFDRGEFRRSFTAAGGVWLDVDEAGYTTYDGSHLVKESSLEWSRATGQAIAEARGK
jgi:hypothetical protein